MTASTVLDRFERGDLPGYRLFGRKGGPVRFRLFEIEAAVASWHVERATPVKRGPWPSGRQPEAVA